MSFFEQGFFGPVSWALLTLSIVVYVLSFIARRESPVITAGFLAVCCLIGLGVQWLEYRNWILLPVDAFVASWLFRLYRGSDFAPILWVCLLTCVVVSAHLTAGAFPVWGISYGKLLNILFVARECIVAGAAIGLWIMRRRQDRHTHDGSRLFRWRRS